MKQPSRKGSSLGSSFCFPCRYLRGVTIVNGNWDRHTLMMKNRNIVCWNYQMMQGSKICTWWLIPLSKWVISPVISGLTLLIPFITGVITHLLSGMSHQVGNHSAARIPQLPSWFQSKRQVFCQGFRLELVGLSALSLRRMFLADRFKTLPKCVFENGIPSGYLT